MGTDSCGPMLTPENVSRFSLDWPPPTPVEPVGRVTPTMASRLLGNRWWLFALGCVFAFTVGMFVNASEASATVARQDASVTPSPTVTTLPASEPTATTPLVVSLEADQAAALIGGLGLVVFVNTIATVASFGVRGGRT